MRRRGRTIQPRQRHLQQKETHANRDGQCLAEEERELILRRLVNLGGPFEPTPAMEDAIQEGLRSLREEKTYSVAEVRSRIDAWTARNLFGRCSGRFRANHGIHRQG